MVGFFNFLISISFLKARERDNCIYVGIEYKNKYDFKSIQFRFCEMEPAKLLALMYFEARYIATSVIRELSLGTG